MLLQRAPVWLAALWWGSLTTVGFGVVPLLFANLPTPAIAGAMAAKLFSAQTWASTVCALLLLTLSRRGDGEAAPQIKAAALFILGGLLLALLSEFAVAPRIVARDNLALWHSVGSGMYLLQWVCSAVVLWRMTASRPS
jgi:hypothetical protein